LKGINDYRRPDRSKSGKKYPEGIEDVQTIRLAGKRSQEFFLEQIRAERNNFPSPHKLSPALKQKLAVKIKLELQQ